jgi:hypothetical protein
VLVFVKIGEPARRPAKDCAGSNHNDKQRIIVMATQSYRERMKAARAEASAQRKAEQAEYRKQLELVCEVRRLALDAVKEEIRARGDKVQLYSRASLQAMADESISPFLKAQANLKRMQVARTRTQDD